MGYKDYLIPELKGIVQGSYGNTITVTLTDFDGNAQDVSTFDGTKKIYGRHKDTGKEVNATLSFDSDGSDGVLTFSWADGDIDAPGDWIVQVVLQDSGPTMKVKSLPSLMPVESSIDA